MTLHPVTQLHGQPHPAPVFRRARTVEERDRIIARIWHWKGKEQVAHHAKWHVNDAGRRWYTAQEERAMTWQVRWKRRLAGVRTGDQWLARLNAILEDHEEGRITDAEANDRLLWIGCIWPVKPLSDTSVGMRSEDVS